MMSSRSAIPSHTQQEMLLECLEEKPWLATGYARTNQGRERTRAAWQEISRKLSSDGSGCIKTWQQWAKYWKDKKSAVKKKYSQMRLARQRTGGGAGEEIVLSTIEERIMSLLGGEQFAIGDREHAIDPFHETVPEPVPSTSQGQHGQVSNQQNVETTISESILQVYPYSLAVEQGSNIIENELILPTEETCPPPPPTLPAADTPVPPLPAADIPSPPPPARDLPPQPASSVTSTPQRRRLRGRRRLVRRSPPSQRHSQMANLTERFIAIEEERNRTDQMLARNQQQLINVLNSMSEAWLRQSQALQDLVNKISNN